MSEQQNKGICPPHNPTGEWSVRDGKSYATCRNCGEYETSLMEKDTHPLTMEERFMKELNQYTIDFQFLTGKECTAMDINYWWLSKISSAVSQALKEKKDTTLKLIDKYYLQYCREQNGLDHCKNCGLNIDELEELLSNNKE